MLRSFCKLTRVKKLNLIELRKFSNVTYNRHYLLYPWARMNPTMHKLLKHGCDIVSQFPLPAAYFAEDASECMHKIYRDTLKNHVRQNNRINRILDTFNRAVYCTDPVVSMVYLDNRIKKDVKKEISPQVKPFLLEE